MPLSNPSPAHLFFLILGIAHRLCFALAELLPLRRAFGVWILRAFELTRWPLCLHGELPIGSATRPAPQDGQQCLSVIGHSLDKQDHFDAASRRHDSRATCMD